MAWNEEIRLINQEAKNLWMELWKLQEKHESIQKRLLPADGASGQVLGKASSVDWAFSWQTVSTGAASHHIDGGTWNSIYLSDQHINGEGW